MIELDARYSNPAQCRQPLPPDLVASLPLPIRDELLAVEGQQDPQLKLQLLCLDLIPLTLQYLALIVASDYLASPAPPNAAVTDSLWNMIRRPGPGKWVGFLRGATAYLAEAGASALSSEALDALRLLLGGESRPGVAIAEEDGTVRTLDYLDALVNVRNRFAHQYRKPSAEVAQRLVDAYLQIYRATLLLLRPVFALRLLLATYEQGRVTVTFLDQRAPVEVAIPPEAAGATLYLVNPATGQRLALLPFVIAWPEPPSETNGALLLEEAKAKFLLYVFGNDFIKRRAEYEQLMKLFAAKTVPQATVGAAELNLSLLAERIDRVTDKTITAFQDSLKFVSGIYQERPEITRRLDEWLQSQKPGCVLIGLPGTGKTTLVTGWGQRLREAGHHVLLLEAPALSSPNLEKVFQDLLGLDAPLRDCLDQLARENRERTEVGEVPVQFVIIVDAVNEFVGKNLQTRAVLWREANSLVRILDGYRTFCRLLLTTREDVLRRDFPTREAVANVLAVDYYFGEPDAFGIPSVPLGLLTEGEAQAIYERACGANLGMSPVTPFDALPTKTREAMRSPFHLRLVLQIFNGLDVPGLSRHRIETLFAKAKILEERVKRRIVFALLDRMSQLRTTRVPLEQLIEGGSAKRKEDLSKLVLDPRPDSPYHKLVQDGIIEETETRDADGSPREEVTFSQEKVSRIIYNEYQKRDLRRVLRTGAMYVGGLILVSLIMYYYLGQVPGASVPDPQSTLAHLFPDGRASSLASNLELYVRLWAAGGQRFLMVLCPGVGLLAAAFSVFLSLSRSLGARLIPLDPPSRFAKEELRLRKLKIGRAVNALAWAYLLLAVANALRYDSLQQKYQVIFASLPPIVGILLLGELFVGAIVVLRHGNAPESAYLMFGPQEAKLSLVTLVPFLLFAASLSLVVPLTIEGLEQATNGPVLRQLRSEVLTDEAYKQLLTMQSAAETDESLRRAASRLVNKIDTIVDKDADTALGTLNTSLQQLIQIIWGIGVFVIPAAVALEVGLARPVYAVMARREKALARSPV
ncbi:MAG: NACHT domain-containing protein [Candidatus Rokubacteria bacterium]|nr:NACHT domain-containing protein [Candidatus Rokubacteria bacterium]